MKKTIYLISGLILLAVIVLIAVFFSSRNKQTSPAQENSFIPTAIPIPTSRDSVPLKIIRTDPLDKKTAVPVNQIITITFNRNLAPQDVSFAILPDAPHVANIVNNQLLVNFTATLSAHTTYTYTITSKGTVVTHPNTFTSADAVSAITNDNAAETMTNWSRANEPDLFLYNHVPYSTTNFSVTGDSTQTAPYHFYFTVSLTGLNTDEDKKEFVAWVASLGLTNDQIQKLDIRFQ